jgi:hypothetical protein
MMHPALRRAMLLGALAVALAGLIAAGAAALAASAASATPIALDAPDNGAAPLVAYDPVSQTTYVAWGDPASTGIDLCILPAGATACEGGGPVLLTNAAAFPSAPPSLGSLAVLPGGDAVVIGIEDASNPIAYVSPADGSAFLTASQGRQNGGEPLANMDDYYQQDNVAPLSSTDMALLGGFSVGDDDFVDTSLAAAAPALTYPNANPSSQYGYNVAGSGPDIAAEPAPAPAGDDVVVDVGASSGGPAISGCVNDDATGYGVVVGKIDGTAAGAEDLNGKVSSGGGGLQGYSLLECAANDPVLAQGGQDGIGLLEEEGPCISGAGSGVGLYYHPFEATAIGGSFGPGVKLADVTNETLCGVNTLDLAEDSGTGMYAEWTDGQGLVLDYSANGGASWEPSAVVPEPASGGQGNPMIAGAGDGNAEIAYVGNPGTGPQVFLEPINYATVSEIHAAPAATDAEQRIQSRSDRQQLQRHDHDHDRRDPAGRGDPRRDHLHVHARPLRGRGREVQEMQARADQAQRPVRFRHHRGGQDLRQSDGGRSAEADGQPLAQDQVAAEEGQDRASDGDADVPIGARRQTHDAHLQPDGQGPQAEEKEKIERCGNVVERREGHLGRRVQSTNR